jgi:predicted ATP-dependent endonuclease of OLD family
MRALEVFLNNKPLPVEYVHKIRNKRAGSCRIILTFSVDSQKNKEIPREFIINNEIKIEKEFSLDEYENIEPKVRIKRHVFSKTEFNDVSNLKASQLKEIFKELSLDYTTVDEAKETLSNYIKENFENLEKNEDWFEIRWSSIAEFLPLFEYYDSSAYGNPQRLIADTLNGVYRSYFYDYDEEGNENIKKEFTKKETEIRNELNDKIEKELKEKVKSIISKVKNISGEFDIDFAQGFNLSNILVDYGTGFNSLNNIGVGSKKRLFLAITEWDKEIRMKESRRRVIRGYDEPDASLHYNAQKEMYYTLKNLSDNTKAQIQIIIATHSLSMVDRAPAGLINNLTQEKGISKIEYLKSDDDEDLKDFLMNVSEISGIRNSSLFFERCYLIVEGATEINTLPIIYKKVTGRSLLEDGVVLIDLETNSSWRSFLKLLSKNKVNSTVLFLDSDTQNQDSKSKITKQSLQQIGFGEDFLTKSVIFAGNQEFEDSFSDQIICRCLNANWPKKEGQQWEESKIGELRSNGKFSEKLIKMVGDYKREENMGWNYARKPDFGKKIAELITLDEINQIESLKLMIQRVSEIIR